MYAYDKYFGRLRDGLGVGCRVWGVGCRMWGRLGLRVTCSTRGRVARGQTADTCMTERVRV